MKKYVMMAICCLIVYSGMAQSENWITHESDKFSIQYPDSWQTDLSGKMATSIIILSPVSSTVDNFRENVNVMIQDLSGLDLDLQKFTELSLNQIQQMIQNSHVIENQRIESSNGAYQQLVFTGESGEFQIRFMQQFRIVNDLAYVLTFSCEITEFEKYQSDGEKIMASFEIK